MALLLPIIVAVVAPVLGRQHFTRRRGRGMNGVAVFSASGRSAQCGRFAGIGCARLCAVVTISISQWTYRRVTAQVARDADESRASARVFFTPQ